MSTTTPINSIKAYLSPFNPEEGPIDDESDLYALVLSASERAPLLCSIMTSKLTHSSSMSHTIGLQTMMNGLFMMPWKQFAREATYRSSQLG